MISKWLRRWCKYGCGVKLCDDCYRECVECGDTICDDCESPENLCGSCEFMKDEMI